MLLILISILERLAELKSANTKSSEAVVSAEAAFRLEEKLSEQLALFKSDMISTRDLQSKITDLQEAKVLNENRDLIKEQQISKMQTQLSTLHKVETHLNEKIHEMEINLAKQMAFHEGELRKLKEELDKAHSKLRAADQFGATLTAEVEGVKKELKAKEEEVILVNTYKEEYEKRVCFFWIHTQLPTITVLLTRSRPTKS
jgi:chromosome segregation ATPase